MYSLGSAYSAGAREARRGSARGRSRRVAGAPAAAAACSAEHARAPGRTAGRTRVHRRVRKVTDRSSLDHVADGEATDGLVLQGRERVSLPLFRRCRASCTTAAGLNEREESATHLRAHARAVRAADGGDVATAVLVAAAGSSLLRHCGRGCSVSATVAVLGWRGAFACASGAGERSSATGGGADGRRGERRGMARRKRRRTGEVCWKGEAEGRRGEGPRRRDERGRRQSRLAPSPPPTCGAALPC